MGAALNLLLDTSTLIWATSAPSLLTRGCRGRSLGDGDNDVFVSAASAWEIATKHRLGRLAQAQPLVDGLARRARAGPLRPARHHAAPCAARRRYDVAHGDPFDRIIAAQAELEEMTLVASDRAFDLFPVTRLW